MRTHDVVVVGAGPAGLAAARALRDAGIADVVVLEREPEAGGIPRHCGHRTFGIAEFQRVLTGPAYAARLRALAGDIDVRTSVSVTRLHPDGVVSVVTPGGPGRIRGRRVLLATGARETPRPPRLVSGTRPVGVLTTGALQQLTYLGRLRPAHRAVVVGSELVSFSAVMTLRHADVDVAAMIEQGRRLVTWTAAGWYAAALGIPVLRKTRLQRIEGGERVSAVVLERADGRRARIACDAVVFTGAYVPETALLRGSHLALAGRVHAPQIDQAWACSDGVYHAAGNVLRPVETAAWAFREGREAGRAIAASLRGDTPRGRVVAVRWEAPIKIVVPSRLVVPGPALSRVQFTARVGEEVRGRLRVLIDGTPVWARRVHLLPDRRVRLPRALPLGPQSSEVRVELLRG